MSLTSILKEIETNRPNAEMDVNIGNEATYRGRAGLKRAATETLKRLRIDYRNELMSSTVFIVVTGAARDQFTELATNETFGCFSSDPEAFYKDLTSRISPKLFGRENVKNLFNIAGNILETKALELDINSYPSLSYNDRYNLPATTPEEFVPIIRNAINDQVGAELVGIDAIHSIVDAAIKKSHTAKITPLVLNTSDEKFALDLYKNLKKRKLADGTSSGLSDKVFLVVAGKSSKEMQKTDGAVVVKTASEESVGEALVKIKDRL
jgi:hypothetical protein